MTFSDILHPAFAPDLIRSGFAQVESIAVAEADFEGKRCRLLLSCSADRSLRLHLLFDGKQALRSAP